jgi:hypothetical protein
MINAIEEYVGSPTTLTPELLPSPSDELSAVAAHSRGCASGNTLAPTSRGITLRAQFALNTRRFFEIVARHFYRNRITH